MRRRRRESVLGRAHSRRAHPYELCVRSLTYVAKQTSLREVTRETGPELVIGLVTPIGTNTAELSDNIAGCVADYNYTPIHIKLSAQLPSETPPLGEAEDHRVRRLIAAGDE